MVEHYLVLHNGTLPSFVFMCMPLSIEAGVEQGKKNNGLGDGL